MYKDDRGNRSRLCPGLHLQSGTSKFHANEVPISKAQLLLIVFPKSLCPSQTTLSITYSYGKHLGNQKLFVFANY